MNELNLVQRLVSWLAGWVGLAAVTAVPVGRDNDGVNRPLWSAGTEQDRNWGDHWQTLNDSLEAWRTNPLAKRIISLITAYTIGDGIRISSEYKTLAKFIAAFYAHPQNNIELELPEWSDELARSGELFLTLHTNEVDGMSYVRAIPASAIDQVEWKDGDYKTELRYREPKGLDEPVWWVSPHHPSAEDITKPVMLHYAVNRPVGAVRGVGDLDPILPWLRRYTRWLEDRVRLNAGVRSFLWVVKATKNLLADLRERYKSPPEPGSIIIAEQGAEEWEAVAPSLHAQDAESDGRAIRWMIAAGGPGTALIDLGEGEDSNQATGAVMQEQKRRFLRRRQRYITYILCDLILQAYARQQLLGRQRSRVVSMADLIVHAPDISPEDNKDLAAATKQLADALVAIRSIVGLSEQFKRMALRFFTKFAGEQLSESEFESIIEDGQQNESQAQVVSNGANELSEQRTAILTAVRKLRSSLQFSRVRKGEF